METLIRVYLMFFVAGAVINIVHALALNSRFVRYMEEHHPEKWNQLASDQFLKKALLWPFVRGNVVEFIWKSTENYGDPQVKLFRHKLRWALYGWGIYLGGGAIGFALLSIAADLWSK